jgi:hypothetical protein
MFRFDLLVTVGLSLLWFASAQYAPLLLDNTAILDVPGRADVNPNGWGDSYSVGNFCYCETNFDHNIDVIVVSTPRGRLTVRQVCALLGPGPGSAGRPRYNDIQCGNGPPNSAGDEDTCPGRIEYGQKGCKYIGPKWNFANVPPAPTKPRPPPPAPRAPVRVQARPPTRRPPVRFVPTKPVQKRPVPK